MWTRTRFALLSFALWSGGAASAETIFQCRIGVRQATVTLENDRLTYRYGRPGRPEISITGGPASGNVSYHRTLYARAELQTLRFRGGRYSYIVHSFWAAPSAPDHRVPEHFEGGLAVLRDGRLIARMRCRPGDGDMREYPIFTRLPQEAENPLPER